MTGTADRPRQRIPLDQAIELLHQVYAEQEAADRSNDPETRRAREDNAHALGRQLIAGTPLGDLQARRNAAAAISRTLIEPEAWHKATVDAGHTAIDLAALNTPKGAMKAKRVLCRMVCDHPELLPPGLAHHTATALYLSMFGERDTWLTRRSGKGGKAHHLAVSDLASVYYRAGYYGLGLEQAAKVMFPNNPSRWPTLETFRTRHSDLVGAFEYARDQGVADGKAGRPDSCPFEINYTRDQLEVLDPASRKKAPRGNKIK
jgi:hypothetical protein